MRRRAPEWKPNPHTMYNASIYGHRGTPRVYDLIAGETNDEFVECRLSLINSIHRFKTMETNNAFCDYNIIFYENGSQENLIE